MQVSVSRIPVADRARVATFILDNLYRSTAFSKAEQRSLDGTIASDFPCFFEDEQFNKGKMYVAYLRPAPNRLGVGDCEPPPFPLDYDVVPLAPCKPEWRDGKGYMILNGNRRMVSSLCIYPARQNLGGEGQNLLRETDGWRYGERQTRGDTAYYDVYAFSTAPAYEGHVEEVEEALFEAMVKELEFQAANKTIILQLVVPGKRGDGLDLKMDVEGPKNFYKEKYGFKETGRSETNGLGETTIEWIYMQKEIKKEDA